MERLNMETVATDGHCLFQRFCPFVEFETIQNNVQLVVTEGKITKYTGVNFEYLVIIPT
jgi:hypothetical protein